jgi:hypothetical protein
MKFKLYNKARFMYHQSEVLTKVHALSCAHILFKIIMPLIQITHMPLARD